MSGRWADTTDDEVDGIPDTHHDPGDGPDAVTPEKVSRISTELEALLPTVSL